MCEECGGTNLSNTIDIFGSATFCEDCKMIVETFDQLLIDFKGNRCTIK
jgi:thiol-disulfide isomerase/thioredoxin